MRTPDDIDQVLFYRDLTFGPVLLHASYIAPTAYGADRYVAKVRQALIDCSSYIDSDGCQVTHSPLSFPNYADDTVAVRTTYTAPDESWVFEKAWSLSAAARS